MSYNTHVQLALMASKSPWLRAREEGRRRGESKKRRKKRRKKGKKEITRE
jgi:hypothetical protein